ncbi:hypothetical protein M5K25_000201 [Dendrobium thyrsiflorum]|uniref:Uncharacterized protein n=1 Tax=Dendrobium thyrsiflorum TaxID=117978 RepID=A0ABD0W6U4_DENTH
MQRCVDSKAKTSSERDKSIRPHESETIAAQILVVGTEKKRVGCLLPSDLIALADLIHAIGEDAKGSEEDGNGAGSLGRDPSSVPNRRESTRRRTILQHGHLLHAHHPRFLPNHRLRHPPSDKNHPAALPELQIISIGAIPTLL